MMGPEVLGRLVEGHAAALVLFARQWCSAPEDVVQEAFLKLVSCARPPAETVPWLYRVVRNAAISVGRAEKRRRQHESIAAARMPTWFTAPVGATLDAETASAAVQGLPPEQREVIIAHLWGGLTFDQIGEMVGCSSSTAHRWYEAGLAALRERLGVACLNPRTMPS
jgi:RNA polymerase sigma-70 factor (ECF subfamily)